MLYHCHTKLKTINFKMKLKGKQKYFLLLVLSLGIFQGSFAYFSSYHVDSCEKHTNIHSKYSQSIAYGFLFDIVEEDHDNDSDDTRQNFGFLTPSGFNFTVPNISAKTILNFKSYAFQSLNHQKIIILNCSFLI